MTAKEFVQRVWQNQPDPIKYNEWSVKERKILTKDIRFEEYNNEILNLIHNFDVSDFDVGGISFDNELHIFADYTYFGWDNFGDRICYYRFSKEVFTYYVAADEYQFKCASNDGEYLDALFELYMLYLKRLVSEDRKDFRQLDLDFENKINSLLNQEYWAFWKRFMMDEYED